MWLFDWLWDSLKNATQDIWNSASDTISDIWWWIKQWAWEVLNILSDSFDDISKWYTEWYTDTQQKWWWDLWWASSVIQSIWWVFWNISKTATWLIWWEEELKKDQSQQVAKYQEEQRIKDAQEQQQKDVQQYQQDITDFQQQATDFKKKQDDWTKKREELEAERKQIDTSINLYTPEQYDATMNAWKKKWDWLATEWQVLEWEYKKLSEAQNKFSATQNKDYSIIKTYFNWDDNSYQSFYNSLMRPLYFNDDWTVKELSKDADIVKTKIKETLLNKATQEYYDSVVKWMVWKTDATATQMLNDDQFKNIINNVYSSLDNTLTDDVIQTFKSDNWIDYGKVEDYLKNNQVFNSAMNDFDTLVKTKEEDVINNISTTDSPLSYKTWLEVYRKWMDTANKWIDDKIIDNTLNNDFLWFKNAWRKDKWAITESLESDIDWQNGIWDKLYNLITNNIWDAASLLATSAMTFGWGWAIAWVLSKAWAVKNSLALTKAANVAWEIIASAPLNIWIDSLSWDWDPYFNMFMDWLPALLTKTARWDVLKNINSALKETTPIWKSDALLKLTWVRIDPEKLALMSKWDIADTVSSYISKFKDEWMQWVMLVQWFKKWLEDSWNNIDTYKNFVWTYKNSWWLMEDQHKSILNHMDEVINDASLDDASKLPVLKQDISKIIDSYSPEALEKILKTKISADVLNSWMYKIAKKITDETWDPQNFWIIMNGLMANYFGWKSLKWWDIWNATMRQAFVDTIKWAWFSQEQAVSLWRKYWADIDNFDKVFDIVKSWNKKWSISDISDAIQWWIKEWNVLFDVTTTKWIIDSAYDFFWTKFSESDVQTLKTTVGSTNNNAEKIKAIKSYIKDSWLSAPLEKDLAMNYLQLKMNNSDDSFIKNQMTNIYTEASKNKRDSLIQTITWKNQEEILSDISKTISWNKDAQTLVSNFLKDINLSSWKTKYSKWINLSDTFRSLARAKWYSDEAVKDMIWWIEMFDTLLNKAYKWKVNIDWYANWFFDIINSDTDRLVLIWLSGKVYEWIENFSKWKILINWKWLNMSDVPSTDILKAFKQNIWVLVHEIWHYMFSWGKNWIMKKSIIDNIYRVFDKKFIDTSWKIWFWNIVNFLKSNWMEQLLKVRSKSYEALANAWKKDELYHEIFADSFQEKFMQQLLQPFLVGKNWSIFNDFTSDITNTIKSFVAIWQKSSWVNTVSFSDLMDAIAYWAIKWEQEVINKPWAWKANKLMKALSDKTDDEVLRYLNLKEQDIKAKSALSSALLHWWVWNQFATYIPPVRDVVREVSIWMIAVDEAKKAWREIIPAIDIHPVYLTWEWFSLLRSFFTDVNPDDFQKIIEKSFALQKTKMNHFWYMLTNLAFDWAGLTMNLQREWKALSVASVLEAMPTRMSQWDYNKWRQWWIAFFNWLTLSKYSMMTDKNFTIDLFAKALNSDMSKAYFIRGSEAPQMILKLNEIYWGNFLWDIWSNAFKAVEDKLNMLMVTTWEKLSEVEISDMMHAMLYSATEYLEIGYNASKRWLDSTDAILKTLLERHTNSTMMSWEVKNIHNILKEAIPDFQKMDWLGWWVGSFKRNLHWNILNSAFLQEISKIDKLPISSELMSQFIYKTVWRFTKGTSAWSSSALVDKATNEMLSYVWRAIENAWLKEEDMMTIFNWVKSLMSKINDLSFEQKIVKSWKKIFNTSLLKWDDIVKVFSDITSEVKTYLKNSWVEVPSEINDLVWYIQRADNKSWALKDWLVWDLVTYYKWYKYNPTKSIDKLSNEVIKRETLKEAFSRNYEEVAKQAFFDVIEEWNYWDIKEIARLFNIWDKEAKELFAWVMGINPENVSKIIDSNTWKLTKWWEMQKIISEIYKGKFWFADLLTNKNTNPIVKKVFQDLWTDEQWVISWAFDSDLWIIRTVQNLHTNKFDKLLAKFVSSSKLFERDPEMDKAIGRFTELRRWIVSNAHIIPKWYEWKSMWILWYMSNLKKEYRNLTKWMTDWQVSNVFSQVFKDSLNESTSFSDKEKALFNFFSDYKKDITNFRIRYDLTSLEWSKTFVVEPEFFNVTNKSEAISRMTWTWIYFDNFTISRLSKKYWMDLWLKNFTRNILFWWLFERKSTAINNFVIWTNMMMLYNVLSPWKWTQQAFSNWNHAQAMIKAAGFDDEILKELVWYIEKDIAFSFLWTWQWAFRWWNLIAEASDLFNSLYWADSLTKRQWYKYWVALWLYDKYELFWREYLNKFRDSYSWLRKFVSDNWLDIARFSDVSYVYKKMLDSWVELNEKVLREYEKYLNFYKTDYNDFIWKTRLWLSNFYMMDKVREFSSISIVDNNRWYFWLMKWATGKVWNLAYDIVNDVRKYWLTSALRNSNAIRAMAIEVAQATKLGWMVDRISWWDMWPEEYMAFIWTLVVPITALNMTIFSTLSEWVKWWKQYMENRPDAWVFQWIMAWMIDTVQWLIDNSFLHYWIFTKNMLKAYATWSLYWEWDEWIVKWIEYILKKSITDSFTKYFNYRIQWYWYNTNLDWDLKDDLINTIFYDSVTKSRRDYEKIVNSVMATKRASWDKWWIIDYMINSVKDIFPLSDSNSTYDLWIVWDDVIDYIQDKWLYALFEKNPDKDKLSDLLDKVQMSTMKDKLKQKWLTDKDIKDMSYQDLLQACIDKWIFDDKYSPFQKAVAILQGKWDAISKGYDVMVEETAKIDTEEYKNLQEEFAWYWNKYYKWQSLSWNQATIFSEFVDMATKTWTRATMWDYLSAFVDSYSKVLKTTLRPEVKWNKDFNISQFSKDERYVDYSSRMVALQKNLMTEYWDMLWWEKTVWMSMMYSIMKNDPSYPLKKLNDLSWIDSNLASLVYVNNFKHILEQDWWMSDEVLTPFNVLFVQAANQINKSWTEWKANLYKNLLWFANNYLDLVEQTWYATDNWKQTPNINPTVQALSKMTLAYWLTPFISSIKQAAPDELKVIMDRIWKDNLERFLDRLSSSAPVSWELAFQMATGIDVWWWWKKLNLKDATFKPKKQYTDNIKKAIDWFNKAVDTYKALFPTSSWIWNKFQYSVKSLEDWSLDIKPININAPATGKISTAKWKSTKTEWVTTQQLKVKKWKVSSSSSRAKSIRGSKVYSTTIRI